MKKGQNDCLYEEQQERYIDERQGVASVVVRAGHEMMVCPLESDAV